MLLTETVIVSTLRTLLLLVCLQEKLETFQSVLRLSPSATRSTVANDIGYLDFCTLSFSKVSLSLEDILSILEGTCFLFPQFLCV